jgi:2,5-diketo-D-gluconate reductase A
VDPHQVELGDGVTMPHIGYGTWPIGDQEAGPLVAAAIAAGYRLIDTAELYRNEVGVGRGIRASGVDREEVFVTTKLSRRSHGRLEAQRAFADSASRLGLDYVDLFLIHWPNPDLGRYVDAWRGMIELLEQGLVRAIGVSNFKTAHLQRLVEETGVTPHVNQIQLNPWVPRLAEREYHRARGIVTESWAPIGKGGGLLDDPVITGLASTHGRTPAQIVIRWHLQLGLVPIPKTANPRRMLENIDVFDFALADEEMDLIATLNRDGRGAVDSDHTGL